MKRFVDLFAIIVATTIATIIAIILTFSTLFVIHDTFGYGCIHYYFPHVHVDADIRWGGWQLPVQISLPLTMIGWLLVYRLCRYWNRMELRAAAPEGKTESWEPSPEEIRKFKWKRFAVFVVLAAAAILSVVALLLTFADSSDILSIVFEWALEILSILFEWFLVYRLWRYWKRMALHAPVPEPDGKDRLLKLVGKYYLERGKNAEVVKLYEGADISEAYPEDLVILALANVRLGNYETALKFYNDKRLASVSIKNLAADFPGIDTPNHLEASLLRIFVQS